MAENLPEKLDEVIMSKLNDVTSAKNGSEEEKRAIDATKTLYQLRIEERKNEQSYQEKQDRLEMEKSQFDDGLYDKKIEMEFQREKLEEEVKARKNSGIREWVTFGVTTGLTVTGFLVGLHFEKTGMITSQFVRKAANKLLHFSK